MSKTENHRSKKKSTKKLAIKTIQKHTLADGRYANLTNVSIIRLGYPPHGRWWVQNGWARLSSAQNPRFPVRLLGLEPRTNGLKGRRPNRATASEKPCVRRFRPCNGGVSDKVTQSQNRLGIVCESSRFARYGVNPITASEALHLLLRDVGVDPDDHLLAVHHAVGLLVAVGRGNHQRLAAGRLLRLGIHRNSKHQLITNDCC